MTTFTDNFKFFSVLPSHFLFIPWMKKKKKQPLAWVKVKSLESMTITHLPDYFKMLFSQVINLVHFKCSHLS